MLYDLIDLNSKGYIDFEEFAEFIVNRASLINKFTTNFQSDAIKSYSLSTIRSKLKLVESTSKSIYIPEIDRLAILEDKSTNIKFLIPQVYLIENGKLMDKELEVVCPEDSHYYEDHRNEQIKSKVLTMSAKKNPLVF